MIEKFELNHWYIFKCNDEELIKNRKNRIPEHSYFIDSMDFVIKEKYLKCISIYDGDKETVCFLNDPLKKYYSFFGWLDYFYDVTKLIKYKKFLNSKL